MRNREQNETTVSDSEFLSLPLQKSAWGNIFIILSKVVLVNDISLSNQINVTSTTINEFVQGENLPEQTKNNIFEHHSHYCWKYFIADAALICPIDCKILQCNQNTISHSRLEIALK